MNLDPADIKNDNLNSMNEEELKALRRFLFEERIAIMNEKKAQEELYEKFMDERLSFREEMKQLNSKVLKERKRLKDEQAFFDKKMMILQTGFANLEMDRKAFQKEKASYKKQLENTSSSVFDNSALFSGVTSYLGLRKRYKELLRIFHPDNLDGDNNMALAIKEEYDRLKDRF